jgi:hypothetical protein
MNTVSKQLEPVKRNKKPDPVCIRRTQEAGIMLAKEKKEEEEEEKEEDS